MMRILMKLVANLKPYGFLILGSVSLSLLAGAHAFEHLGGMAPCPLCLDQRTIHWVALVMVLAGFLISKRIRPDWISACYISMGIIFMISTLLAAYHSGIEWKFWPGSAECTSSGFDSTLDILASLEGKQAVITCSDAPWRLFGISMAGYNAIFSFDMALLSFVFAWQSNKSVSNGGQPV